MTKVEKGMLECLGHVERINEKRLTKRIYKESVSRQVGKGGQGNLTGLEM